MLIRSQNKKNLTNLSQVTNVTIITRDSRFKIMACYPVEDGYDYMGEYSTETKAIKVLDMIGLREVNSRRLRECGRTPLPCC